MRGEHCETHTRKSEARRRKLCETARAYRANRQRLAQALLCISATSWAEDASVGTIVVETASRDVRAYGKDGKLLGFYAATIGSSEKPAPSGTFEVRRVAYDLGAILRFVSRPLRRTNLNLPLL